MKNISKRILIKGNGGRPFECTVHKHRYTDKELLSIYEEALKRLEIEEKEGRSYPLLCELIINAQNIIKRKGVNLKRIDCFRNTNFGTFGLLSFREIAKYFPKHQKIYWFPESPYGTKKRKYILNQAIKEVKAKLNK